MPPAPWAGLFGADPGQIVSGVLWGAGGAGSLPYRSTDCVDAPGTSDVRSASFTIRGGNNGETVGAGLFSAVFGQICGVVWEVATNSWHVISGADDVNGLSVNTEGVAVTLAWNSAGDYSVTFDGAAAITGNAGAALLDPAAFVCQFADPYDAAAPGDGDWIDNIVLGCAGL